MSILDIFRGEQAVESLHLREIEEKFQYKYENTVEAVYATEKEAIFIVKDEAVGQRLLEVLRAIRGKKIATSDFIFFVSKLILNMEKTRILAFHIKINDSEKRGLPYRIGILNYLEIIGGLQGYGFYFDEGDFDEKLANHFTGLLSLVHQDENAKNSRVCIMKMVHSYYSDINFDDFYKKVKNGTLIRLDNLPYCLELFDICHKCFQTFETPESIYDAVSLEELRRKNIIRNDMTILDKKIIQAKDDGMPVYLYSQTPNSAIDKELTDNSGKKHQVYIFSDISNEASKLIEEKYNYIYNTTKIEILGLIADTKGKIIGYEYKIKKQTGYKPLPEESEFKTQAEKIKFVASLTNFILNTINISKYTTNNTGILSTDLMYKIDDDGRIHFEYSHIEDLEYLEGQTKEQRLKGILEYFKKMYFNEKTLNYKTKNELLACEEIRYLSPRLAQECCDYILGSEDEDIFANELYFFLTKYELSSDGRIAYYKNFAFDPSTVKYSFDFEVSKRLDFYTQRPAKDLKQTKDEYELEISQALDFPNNDVKFIKITEIVFKTSIVGFMYETEGYNTNEKPKRYLSSKHLITLDNISLSKFLRNVVSRFNKASLSSNKFYIGSDDKFYINTIDKQTGIQLRKKRSSNDAIKEFISTLERDGFDIDRLNNIDLYYDDYTYEESIRILDTHCNKHNIYYNKDKHRLCPICGKTLFYLRDSDYLQKEVIHEDKYAKHYKLNDEYNIKIYNENNVNLNELEKIVDSILSRNILANKNMYKQDLFIPLKKALKDNKFIGVVYESVCFDDASQKNYVMNFNDLSILKSFPRLKGCARLVEQVNSLINKRLGFIYNPYGAAFISKEHKKQIQIVYPEFITKDKNLDLADDWTLDYVGKVFTQDKDILHEFNFKPGVTTLEIASNEMNQVINSLDKKCEKHNYRYDKNLICCPKCIPIQEQERIKEHALRFSQKQISELHEFNEGGEANIYDDGDNLIKIFKAEEVDMNFKISVILRILSKKEQILDINRKHKDIEYIIPKEIIISEETNDIIGYTMKKVNGMAIQTLRDKEQVEELGFKEEDVLEILISEGQAIDILHKELNIFIGDLNGRNILFDENKKVYVIDFDGIGIDEYIPEFYTDEYVDPISKENKSITYKDDWYSFAIHTFYYLTYTHPFNGTYYEKINGKKTQLDIPEKMEKRLSLLGNHGIKAPAIAKDWSWMTKDLTEAMRKIFEEGSRECIVPLLIAQRNKLVGVIPLEDNSDSNLKVGSFNVEIEDKSYNGVKRIINEHVNIQNYKGYLRLVARVDGYILAFDVPDLDLIVDAKMTASHQNVLVYYPKSLSVFNLVSGLVYEMPYDNSYDLCLCEDTLYYPDGNNLMQITFKGDEYTAEVLNFKPEYYTTAVGVANKDKFVIVKSNNSRYDVYCNDLLFYTFQDGCQSNDFTVFYDENLNHWLVLGNKGDGLLITSSGRFENFNLFEMAGKDLNYVVFHKDKIFIPQNDLLITYDIHKQLKKGIPLENFISSNSKVIVTENGFKVISGSKIYTFKVNKKS